jgi:hypothetical protein
VKVNGRVGVARTIRNANGKVEIDRSAVYLRSDRPEEALQHAEISATTKIATLSRAPTEFRGSEVRDAPKVSPPVITGQFRETHEITSPRLAPRALSTLHEATYDYKAHGFSMSHEVGTAAEAHPVIVARMNSFGGVYAPSGNSAGAGAVHGLPSAGHMAAASYGTSGGGVSGIASGHSGGGSGASSSAASAAVSASGHPL